VAAAAVAGQGECRTCGRAVGDRARAGEVIALVDMVSGSLQEEPSLPNRVSKEKKMRRERSRAVAEMAAGGGRDGSGRWQRWQLGCVRSHRGSGTVVMVQEEEEEGGG
jgi:hypothetical protein